MTEVHGRGDLGIEKEPDVGLSQINGVHPVPMDRLKGIKPGCFLESSHSSTEKTRMRLSVQWQRSQE